jgi:radical SAM protein with 4Fe4S-binding SPASM domain
MIAIWDVLNVLSKTTFKRAYTILKVVVSYQYSKISGNVVHPSVPYSIAIEPTTSCNLRCPECPSGLRSFTRPTGMLNISMFSKIIDEIHKELSYLIFYFQGEPYLNTAFLEMVKYASSKGIYTATSTNAHYLNDENARKTVESGLDRLIISIDGTTQEVYEQYRIGGSLAKVLDGTKNILAWKKRLHSKTPHVIFQFLVVKPNQHQLKEVRQIAKELGVGEVRFKTAQIYDYKNGSDLIPDIEKFSRYKKNLDDTYTIKNELLNHCWKMWHSCVITWDGKIVPCCFDKDAMYEMGNLNTHSFKYIWNSGPYIAFRKSLLKSRGEIDMCKNCTEGTTVWAS